MPIGTFAVQNTATGLCDFMVTQLDYNDDSVLLGGMFFQEFYGYFQNDYSYTNTYYAQQYASLYI